MIRVHRRRLLAFAGLIASALPAAGTAQVPAAALSIPIDYYKLDNGLKVVLSRDTTSPTVVVAVYYNIGFRIEPRDRTGFAHLFEHLMFNGSEHFNEDYFKALERIGATDANGTTS